MKKKLIKAGILLFLVTLIIILAGCANNYIEHRQYEDGKKVAEYKAGRQSLFVRSDWPFVQISLDPNDVHVIGEGTSDPEKITIITPYGGLESEE